MKKVLIINSSARMLNSRSRKLTDVFIEHWKAIHSSPTIRLRELGNTNVPHITENWITAAFKPEAARSEEEIETLRISAVYISELREADVIVIGAPMYNWSIPSPPKAYIDQVLRINETWKFNAIDVRNAYTGLLKNKTLFLLLSRGSEGYEKGEYNEHLNFQATYLKTVFDIMGISNIHVIAVNGASLDAEKFQKTIAAAHQRIEDLIGMELGV